MFLRKLCFFTMLATIVAFVAVGRLNVQIKGFDVPTPNSRPHDSALAPDGSLGYMGQPANGLGRSHWVKHSARKTKSGRPFFFRSNPGTPRIWAPESCWWRAGTSAIRISLRR